MGFLRLLVQCGDLTERTGLCALISSPERCYLRWRVPLRGSSLPRFLCLTLNYSHSALSKLPRNCSCVCAWVAAHVHTSAPPFCPHVAAPFVCLSSDLDLSSSCNHFFFSRPLMLQTKCCSVANLLRNSTDVLYQSAQHYQANPRVLKILFNHSASSFLISTHITHHLLLNPEVFFKKNEMHYWLNPLIIASRNRNQYAQHQAAPSC